MIYSYTRQHFLVERRKCKLADETYRIMTNLQKISKSSGVKITTMQSAIYLKMYGYATCHASTAPLSFTLSVDEMAERLDVPKRSMVTALKVLTDAGAITRKRSENDSAKKGMAPLTTVLNPEVYEG
ncbi:MAG: hypothetical protein LUB60_02055 [Clostridiales bacterium]|nr:hypothetical protein [Clostridiales bacterium]